uniref:Chemokine interleukin-8-like domain-containing protein n=1 Tax=Pygocentrus nattereri TaxID=42514 RepID=A0AAR2KIH7_PYGNA
MKLGCKTLQNITIITLIFIHRFTTIHGRTVCADPERSWTKFAMCVVDKRKSTSRAEVPTRCERRH